MPLACQVLPYNPDVLILVHNGIFCAKKNRHLQEKQTYVVIYPFTTSTQDFNKKKYFKVDQKLRNETWPHTFCAGKKKSTGALNHLVT